MARFGFTKLVVGDLEACAAFYSAVFGLTEQYRVRAMIGDREIDEIIFGKESADAGTFILLRYTDGAPPAPSGVITGFHTDDIDALFARGTVAGGTIAAEVHDSPEHGVRVGFLADVEGRLIEVVEPLT